MRILLDECVPRPLRDAISGHQVIAAPEMGWGGKKNGELLALMAQNGFAELLTTDRNLRHQQNLSVHGVTVIVMLASSNRLADLVPLIPAVERVLVNLQPGVVVEISG